MDRIFNVVSESSSFLPRFELLYRLHQNQSLLHRYYGDFGSYKQLFEKELLPYVRNGWIDTNWRELTKYGYITGSYSEYPEFQISLICLICTQLNPIKKRLFLVNDQIRKVIMNKDYFAENERRFSEYGLDIMEELKESLKKESSASECFELLKIKVERCNLLDSELICMTASRLMTRYNVVEGGIDSLLDFVLSINKIEETINILVDNPIISADVAKSIISYLEKKSLFRYFYLVFNKECCCGDNFYSIINYLDPKSFFEDCGTGQTLIEYIFSNKNYNTPNLERLFKKYWL